MTWNKETIAKKPQSKNSARLKIMKSPTIFDPNSFEKTEKKLRQYIKIRFPQTFSKIQKSPKNQQNQLSFRQQTTTTTYTRY